MRNPGGLTLLSLGDSYTIGEGVDADRRWPAQLISTLQAENRSIDHADLLATTGWTTDELLEAAAHFAFRPPYDLVSLLIGVNNQYRGRSLDNYAAEFSSLLDLAVGQAGGQPERVITVSIPDWGVTRFAAEKGVDSAAVGAAIDRFNGCARDLTVERGAHWIDITGISRGVARSMLAEDGLHPSAEQYALWVELILPVARRLLASRDR
ncbi:SGNH/GDSL hydrolase family protein [Dokdonella sp.]|uniref:SGNH/GDSL hydrolase family protein n=1 Tax=Dokdonella sp. TaxID=2291710 RepID=UPI003528E77D